MINISGVYAIINTFNNKRYIGYSSNIKERNKKHLLHLRKGDHRNIHLQRAYWKYGEEYFEFQILENCIVDDLPKREHYWAKLYQVHNDKFGYNIRETNPDYIGGKHAQETKDKISAKKIGIKRPDVTARQLGKKLPKEWVDNLSKSKLGKKYGKRSLEWRQNISKGINKYSNSIPKKEKILKILKTESSWKHIPESLQKISNRASQEDNKIHIIKIQKQASEKRKGSYHSIESKLKIVQSKYGNRVIEIFDLHNNLITTCDIVSQAVEITGISRTSIGNNLTGRSRTTSKFIFKYKNIN